MVPALNHYFGQKLKFFTGQKEELWVINTVFSAQVYTYRYIHTCIYSVNSFLSARSSAAGPITLHFCLGGGGLLSVCFSSVCAS